MQSLCKRGKSSKIARSVALRYAVICPTNDDIARTDNANFRDDIQGYEAEGKDDKLPGLRIYSPGPLLFVTFDKCFAAQAPFDARWLRELESEKWPHGTLSTGLVGESQGIAEQAQDDELWQRCPRVVSRAQPYRQIAPEPHKLDGRSGQLDIGLMNELCDEEEVDGSPSRYAFAEVLEDLRHGRRRLSVSLLHGPRLPTSLAIAWQ